MCERLSGSEAKRRRVNENVDPSGQAFFLCGFEGAKLSVKPTPAQHNISGDNSLRVPPVPIPNTEVKPQHADGTWLATARESRSSPDSISLSSSMAEHSAVNRRVVGSSPT